MTNGNLLIDAERSSGDQADGVARREVAEQLSAVVVHAHAGADHDLVIESLGSQAAPIRGAKPHWRPVSVVLLTPAVPFLLLPAMMKPLCVGPSVPGVSPVGRGPVVEM